MPDPAERVRERPAPFLPPLPPRPANSFGGLLFSYAISVLGTAMSALAIPWLVLTTSGSAAQTGLIAFAEMAPYVLLQALGGPLVDRAGARRVYVLGNTAAALVVCAIPAMLGAGMLGLSTLALLVAVAGGVRGLADCAGGVLVPATAVLSGVPVQRAASLFSGANYAGLLLGTPLAGVMVAAVGPSAVVLIDGLTFGAAALLVAAFVPARVGDLPGTRQPAGLTSEPAERHGVGRYLAELAEGARFLARDRLLFGIAVMVSLTNLLDQGLMAVLIPVWVRAHLPGSTALGLLTGIACAGALVGTLAAGWLGQRLSRRKAYALGFLIGGPSRYLMLALATVLSPVLVVFLVAGIAGGMINPIISAVQYERIPERLRARVLGAVKASAWLGVPFGPLLAGVLVDTGGLRATLLVVAGGYLVIACGPLFSSTWRELDHAGAVPAGDGDDDEGAPTAIR